MFHLTFSLEDPTSPVSVFKISARTEYVIVFGLRLHVTVKIYGPKEFKISIFRISTEFALKGNLKNVINGAI